MKKIKFGEITYPMYINWNEFEQSTIPENFTGECRIYVDKLTGDIDEELRKIRKLQSIPGLKEIRIYSKDFRIAEYFDTALKIFQTKKAFHLLNDYEMSNRSNIDFSHMNYYEVYVPLDYMMHMPNSNVTYYTDNEVREGNCIISGRADNRKSHQELPNMINGIVDEIFGKLPMEELDDVDKSVLVSNWIQRKMQFIEGRKSWVQGKKYICDEFNFNNGDVHDMLTAIQHNYGVCSAFAGLSVALLNNPRVNCKCNLVFSMEGGHTYFVQHVDGKQYVVDNTWGITRNPNKMGEALKAKSFSDEYLLIGNDKLNENEDIRIHHISYGCHKYEIADESISRERILQSIEKLKGFGVNFSYDDDQPAVSQHIEDDKINYMIN